MAESVADLLAAARTRLRRLSPQDAAAAVAHGALLVDTRPHEQRQRDGVVPDAIMIDRNVLEWRLDPQSEHRLAEIDGYDRTIVVMCNEGYASSLVAAQLQDMGFADATDVDGGYQAWAAAGLPTAALPTATLPTATLPTAEG
ncbi:MAG: rhodanese-like domain-containing protein [Actinobacteria bacterium]|nr:rhodanese-like domain-containing protein [Actinomycetota bacterium]